MTRQKKAAVKRAAPDVPKLRIEQKNNGLCIHCRASDESWTLFKRESVCIFDNRIAYTGG